MTVKVVSVDKVVVKDVFVRVVVVLETVEDSVEEDGVEVVWHWTCGMCVSKHHSTSR